MKIPAHRNKTARAVSLMLDSLKLAVGTLIVTTRFPYQLPVTCEEVGK
jgi:hypothetical protein